MRSKSFLSKRVSQKIKYQNFLFSNGSVASTEQAERATSPLCSQELFYPPPSKWVAQPRSAFYTSTFTTHEKHQQGPLMELMEEQKKLFPKPSISAMETAVPILV